MAALAFDITLGGLIIAVALAAMLARELLTAIVLFIVYGLLVALAWVRLDALDVALAEAAIGAGLTGILLVGSAGRLRGAGRRNQLRPLPLLIAVLTSIALLILTFSLLRQTPAQGVAVVPELAATGVSNPVTAVLMNFRGYDTLLEVVVLVAALTAVWSLTPDRNWGGAPGLQYRAQPKGVLVYFAQLLPLVGFVVAAHLLWSGSEQHGGAFQAGTVLAAVWLLAAMAGLVRAWPVSSARLRMLVVLGPACFVVFGISGALQGTFLAYPNLAPGLWLMALELVLAISIAAVLSLVVLGVSRRAA
jgi:multisubunit Na+/H+ antiporter MnhB subunit